jgi:hypothetical protein
MLEAMSVAETTTERGPGLPSEAAKRAKTAIATTTPAAVVSAATVTVDQEAGRSPETWETEEFRATQVGFFFIKGGG